MSESELVQINLSQVLANKLGKRAAWLPRWVVKWLERTICQDEMNEMLRKYYPRRDAEFCRECLRDLDVRVDVKHDERFPAMDQRRVIFVCNHPLGGLDGIVLISELCKRYGDGVKFIVNDLLMAVEPLRGVFLPINKHGRQNRQSINDINKALEGPDPVLVFPAGLVSRRSSDGGIKDLDWHKMFVSKALQYHRDVVPLHFSGHNSPFFYKFAQWRKRIGLKFNIEMIYLPREVVHSKGKRFTITVGHRYAWQKLQGLKPENAANGMRETVYSLSKQTLQS